MKMIIILFIKLITFSALGETNLGTINTIQNGFATLNECIPNERSTECVDGHQLGGLSDILNFATTNQCLATKDDFERSDIDVPSCPRSGDAISGLDNTHPTAGIFALYTGNNDSFIHNLVSSYLKENSVGKFNLVIPRAEGRKLRKNAELVALLNSSRVNIVEVNTLPSVGRWMQDSFQFTSIDGKPAIYQLEHYREAGQSFDDRLACELASKCNIPYYIPPDMIDPTLQETSSLNSGGNLEVLPGGTFYTGTVQTSGYYDNVPSDAEIPYRTNSQAMQKSSLEAAGNSVLELDISFLKVGHVDEIINIVKTNKSAPCNYAVLMASPLKAFELMKKSADEREGSGFNIKFNNFFLQEVYAGALALNDGDSLEAANRCSPHTYKQLGLDGSSEIIADERIREIYADDCIDGVPIEDFISSNEYKILLRENLVDSSPLNIASIMENNKKALIEELKVSTSCESPQIIDVPVFFRNGLSYTPDLVNGVVQTSGSSPSNMIIPRTYFSPFDEYMKETLAEVGVGTTLIHDMGYHLLHGEVHCGTNSARICNQ